MSGDRRLTGPPMPDKPVKPVTSSGGVIFNDDGRVLILRRKVERTWVLPKGRVEEGETLRETALREVEEETGIPSPEILQEIGLVRYIFFWHPDDVNYNKTVHYFLMRVPNGAEVNTEEDFGEYMWADEAEAVKNLRHENDRLIARKGFELMSRGY